MQATSCTTFPNISCLQTTSCTTFSNSSCLQTTINSCTTLSNSSYLQTTFLSADNYSKKSVNEQFSRRNNFIPWAVTPRSKVESCWAWKYLSTAVAAGYAGFPSPHAVLFAHSTHPHGSCLHNYSLLPTCQLPAVNHQVCRGMAEEPACRQHKQWQHTRENNRIYAITWKM